MIRRELEEWRSETRSSHSQSGYESDSALRLARPERLQAVSSEEMHRMLSEVRGSAEEKTVMDTMAALVTDVHATTEVLRRGLSRSRDDVAEAKSVRLSEARRGRGTGSSERALSDYEHSSPRPKRAGSVKVLPREPPAPPKTEYRLRLRNAPVDDAASARPFPHKAPKSVTEERCSVERVCGDFGIPVVEERRSQARRGRSGTPASGRLLRIQATPGPAEVRSCGGCGEAIRGPCLTALAPNANAARKYHPHCFVCNYCLRPLAGLRGTFKEEERKPYCHECFYRLFAGTGAA